jgi:hypothetical protein
LKQELKIKKEKLKSWGSITRVLAPSYVVGDMVIW